MQNDGNDSTLLEKLFFDKNGNLIKELSPQYDITITYKYDSLQRNIERKTYCPGIQNETVYSYYSDNMLSKEVRKDSTGYINQTREYFYKDSLLQSEHVSSSFKSRGTSRSYILNYQYDSTGFNMTTLNEEYSRQTEIKRNEYGGIIYFEMINSPYNVTGPVWFTYDKNLRVEEYHFFNKEKIITEKMIYDAKGKIIEKQHCGNDYGNYPCITSSKFYYQQF